jgi:hypothetical protein
VFSVSLDRRHSVPDLDQEVARYAKVVSNKRNNTLRSLHIKVRQAISDVQVTWARALHLAPEDTTHTTLRTLQPL